jgi:DNA-directed RNA polymerase specialized sigma24 family protein
VRVRRRPADDQLATEYEGHRGAVMAMLGKRFPRFDEDERLAIYHDAWVRVIAKRERGEEIESLRAYLLATCAAEALHVVSRSRVPTPVDPDEPLLTSIADGQAPVDEQVVVKDQVRLARDLIDSLDSRQRDVLKLRWDLQLRGPEVRAALGLTRRQYQRIAEEGAAAIAQRVEELQDGTWSRRQRSLLMACLVRVTADGETREGIATTRQRREAQRLLETDPHFAALYAEVRSALKRAAAFLPLPLLVGGGDASAFARVVEAGSDIRERSLDVIGAVKQQATALYIRAADPTLFANPRPGALVATLAGCVAVGGGAFGAYDAVSKPQPRPTPAASVDTAIEPITATAPRPRARAKEAIRRKASPRRYRPKPPAAIAVTPPPNPPPPNPTPPTTQSPQPPSDGTEFSFEN